MGEPPGKDLSGRNLTARLTRLGEGEDSLQPIERVGVALNL